MRAIEKKLPAHFRLVKPLNEMLRVLSRWMAALKRSREKALLYRAQSGEKPYDVSLPRDQWTVLSANRPQWF